jgi:hypothetical protein
MDAKRLIEIIDATNHDARSYSGRGMFGKQCVGVTVDDGVFEWIAGAIEECEDVEEAAWLVRMVKTDDMGRGKILYWPRLDWPADLEAA